MTYLPFIQFAHAFGQRYELPVPLALFVFGGAAVVFLSFLLVLPRKVTDEKRSEEAIVFEPKKVAWPWTVISLIGLALTIACGLTGSQEIPENLVPTLFWLITWIAIPLTCGIFGDYTRWLNPFANAAHLFDSPRLRELVVGRKKALEWPKWLGYWPATILFFALACAELIYNQTATLPAVIASGMLVYVIASAFAGLVFGTQWLMRGEVFSVLLATWGRLGYFRFGTPGKRGFAGGLSVPFEASISRSAFTLLLLISVSFDGLLSTPLWSHFTHGLPAAFAQGTDAYKILATFIFVVLACAIYGMFYGISYAVKRVANYTLTPMIILTSLLPSLLPISFGYLLAHNIEYLVVNSQLLFPLIGNPTGNDNWPITLAYPFNDSYEINAHVLPSSVYWYISVAVIVVVHILAVVLAHRYFAVAGKKRKASREAEYPWMIAMVGYTMLSLWLIAQPLVKDEPSESALPVKSSVAVAAPSAKIE